MAEVEYKGIKVGGSKLLLIIPLIGTIVGGLWGGFEAYQRYLSMEKGTSHISTVEQPARGLPTGERSHEQLATTLRDGDAGRQGGG